MLRSPAVPQKAGAISPHPACLLSPIALDVRGQTIFNFLQKYNSAAVMRTRRLCGMSRRKTYRELEAELDAAHHTISELRSEREELACANNSKKPLDALSEKMSRYEDANTPPPADSL